MLALLREEKIKLPFRCFIGWHKEGSISPNKIPSFSICKLCKRITTPVCDPDFGSYDQEISYEKCQEALKKFGTVLTKEEKELLKSAKI